MQNTYARRPKTVSAAFVVANPIFRDGIRDYLSGIYNDNYTSKNSQFLYAWGRQFAAIMVSENQKIYAGKGLAKHCKSKLEYFVSQYWII